EMDGHDFEQILPILEAARDAGQWVSLAGHDIGPGGKQTTRVAMLDKLMSYANDPANKIWIAPVGAVAKYIRERRAGMGWVGSWNLRPTTTLAASLISVAAVALWPNGGLGRRLAPLTSRLDAALNRMAMSKAAGGPYDTTDHYLRPLEIPRPSEAV